jgi:WhiB family redox-sensing transcriptional regulator
MSLTEAHPDLAWKQSANCKGRMKLFFALRAERPQARVRREAKAQKLCAECAVQEICKSFARNFHEYGFWGGENEEDRHLAGFTVAAPIGIRAREARSA